MGPEMVPEIEAVEKIKIIVAGDFGEHHYKVTLHTPMKILKSYYSDRIYPYNILRFLFDGRRVHDDDTAYILEMEDGDRIEVYYECTGGGS